MNEGYSNVARALRVPRVNGYRNPSNKAVNMAGNVAGKG